VNRSERGDSGTRQTPAVSRQPPGDYCGPYPRTGESGCSL
jgi:hypothetical protein